MPNPATYQDVEARWRPLTTAERTVADTRLDDAWRKLKRDVSDLQTRMVDDTDLTADVVRVLADAVIRVLRSNELNGKRRGTVSVDDGSASWEAGDDIRSDLYFTESEYADLRGAGRRRGARAFSVQPT